MKYSNIKLTHPFVITVALSVFLGYPCFADSKPYYWDEIAIILGIQTPAQEQALLADAEDAHFSQHTLAMAAMIASGVYRGEQRSGLELKFERIVSESKQAFLHLAPQERARHLLRWLHDKKLRKYTEKQTAFDGVLDSGDYNCVSVTVLFNSIGRQLGLKLKAVETPKHVFSLLQTASRSIDIETTTKYGFDPTPEAIEAFEKKTGFAHVSRDQSEQRRTVSNVALIALIYFNQAISAIDTNDHTLGLTRLAKALILDPALEQAESSYINLLSLISADWLNQKQFEKALKLLEIGLKIDPGHETMKHNRIVGWTNWALASAENLPAKRAIKIIRRAHEVTQLDHLKDLQGQIFLTEAMQLAEAGNWAAGLKFVQEGKKWVASESFPVLEARQIDYLDQWFSHALTHAHFQQAYTLAVDLLNRDKNHLYVIKNLGYLLQEWTRALFQDEGVLAAEQKLNMFLVAFSQYPGVQDAGANFILWGVGKLNKQQLFAQSIALLERQRKHLSEKKHRQLQVAVYHRWSADYLTQKAWAQAINVYQAALEKWPNEEDFITNEKYAWNEWGKAKIEQKSYRQAVGIYRKALVRFPDDPVFKQNLRFSQAKL